MLGKGREEICLLSLPGFNYNEVGSPVERESAENVSPGPVKIDGGNQCMRIPKGTALGSSRKVSTRIEDI